MRLIFLLSKLSPMHPMKRERSTHGRDTNIHLILAGNPWCRCENVKISVNVMVYEDSVQYQQTRHHRNEASVFTTGSRHLERLPGGAEDLRNLRITSRDSNLGPHEYKYGAVVLGMEPLVCPLTHRCNCDHGS